MIVTRNGRKVEAFGSAKKIRGRRHGAHRPDLAIMDDIENDENVNTPAQRDKLQSFVTKSVLSLGPPDDSMDAILVGTVLHYDSVLSRFLKNPLWNRKVFKAIINWPERMDLWEQFEGLLLNAETPQEGEAAAMAHYRDHQAEMDKGAKVSWPALRPLVKLMLRRAREAMTPSTASSRTTRSQARMLRSPRAFSSGSTAWPNGCSMAPAIPAWVKRATAVTRAPSVSVATTGKPASWTWSRPPSRSACLTASSAT